MSDGTTAPTETVVETTTVATPPAPAQTPAPATVTPPAAPIGNTRLPDDHPLVTTLATVKSELKTFKDAATKADQEKLQREQRYEELLPQKITEATTPLQSQIDKLQKALDKRNGEYETLQASYSGLETSVKTTKVQTTVKDQYLASGAIKEGFAEAFDVIWSTHRSKFTLGEDGSVKAGDQDLVAFFDGLKKAPVFCNLFVSDRKPEGSGTPPNKATSTAPTGKVTVKAADMTRRNWGSETALQDIIQGKTTVTFGDE
jgi:hypothetical protein